MVPVCEEKREKRRGERGRRGGGRGERSLTQESGGKCGKMHERKRHG